MSTHHSPISEGHGTPKQKSLTHVAIRPHPRQNVWKLWVPSRKLGGGLGVLRRLSGWLLRRAGRHRHYGAQLAA